MTCPYCPSTARLSNEPHHLCGHIDVAVLTIIEEEREAVIGILNLEKSRVHHLDNGHHFQYGILKDAGDNELRVAVFCAGKPGNPAITAITTTIIFMLLPRLMVLVGICAGLKGKAKIGSVLLPNHIVDFSFVVAKQINEIGTNLPRHDHKKIHGFVSNMLSTKISVEEKRNGMDVRDAYLVKKINNWDRNNKLNSFPQPTDQSKTYWEDFLNKNISLDEILVDDGTLASSNTLLRDESVLSDLHKHYDQLRGADMEAAGFAEACDGLDTDWFIIRSVSDLGDKTKSDIFQPYASANAAAYLALLLTHDRNAKLIRNKRSDADAFIEAERTALEGRITDLMEMTASSIKEYTGALINISLYWKCTAIYRDESGAPTPYIGVSRSENIEVRQHTQNREPFKFFPYEPSNGEKREVAKCVYDADFERNDSLKGMYVLSVRGKFGEALGALCCTFPSKPVPKIRFESKVINILSKLANMISSTISYVDKSLYETSEIQLNKKP